MSCDHCISPSGQRETSTGCCWSTALEIRKFKKFVFHKYIIEVIFDLLVSVASVITDIASLILYIRKGYWLIALLTAIPVLLPTLVFTNVYMADETQGYCKLPPKKGRNNNRSPTPQTAPSPPPIFDENGSVVDSGSISISLPDSSSSTPTSRNTTFKRKMTTVKSSVWFHFPGCRCFCSACIDGWSGLCMSIFNKDRNLRKAGAKAVQKSLKRLSKYFFGTFVLRFIALAWYVKALGFGIKAFREPKRFMKIERPNTHWSYDLLVRLDFLQAALENAPQCIVQLYLLLTMPDENVLLGLATLFFSFVDFVRVLVSVQWDIHRGPVIAPAGCYGKIHWKILNWCSWIFLYVGRSCALAFVFATSKFTWLTLVPALLIILHIFLFMKLFSQSRYGVAAQKVFVSVFISIFFLPELYSNELPNLVKFYYACIHIQNIIFITPLQGFDYQICFTTKRKIPLKPPPIPRDAFFPEFNSTNDEQSAILADELPMIEKNFFNNEAVNNDNCLIDPLLMVLLVPTLTMVGIIMRLAASHKMSKFKKSLPVTPDKMIMEERVARMYRAKWSQLTIKHLTTSFLRMLKKEVVKSEDEIKGHEKEEETPVYFISPTLNSEFHTSQHFIREAVAFLTAPASFSKKTQRSMSVDEYAIKQGRTQFGKSPTENEFNEDSSFMRLRRLKSNSHDNLVITEFTEYSNRDNESLREQIQSSSSSLNAEFIKVDGPDGPLFLEKSWI